MIVKIAKNIFFKILPQIGRRDIGLYILINCLSPFLNIGVTLASFHISEYMAVYKILLKIILRVKMTESSHERRICSAIPSEPWPYWDLTCELMK